MYFVASIVLENPSPMNLHLARVEGYEVIAQTPTVYSVTGKRTEGTNGYPRFTVPTTCGAIPSLIAFEEVGSSQFGRYFQVVSSLSGKKIVPIIIKDLHDHNCRTSAKFMVGNGLVLARAFPDIGWVNVVALRAYLEAPSLMCVAIVRTQWAKSGQERTLDPKLRKITVAAIRKIDEDHGRATYVAPPREEALYCEGIQQKHRREEQGGRHHSHRGRRS